MSKRDESFTSPKPDAAPADAGVLAALMQMRDMMGVNGSPKKVVDQSVDEALRKTRVLANLLSGVDDFSRLVTR